MAQRVCPKCGFAQDEDREECIQCGIVFAKYHQARDAMLGKTSARIGDRPADEPRVRPMTLVLLVLCLGLGAYAVRTSDLFADPTPFLGVEEGISRGGNIFVPKRERVEVETVGAADEAWTGPTCYGIKVFPDAEPIDDAGAADDAGEGAPAVRTAHYTYATFDSVLDFYREMFGPARVYVEPVVPPESHPDPESVAGIQGRRARWYAAAVTDDGLSMHIDIQVQSPFFDDDGSFHPDGTLISCAMIQ